MWWRPDRQQPRWLTALLATLSSRLAKDSFIVLFYGCLGKGLTLAKELLVAYFFGISDQLDAYVLALLIPSFLVNILGGSFSSALIPAIGKVYANEGEEAAREVIQSSLSVLAGVVVSIAIFLYLLSPTFLRFLSPHADPARLIQIKALQSALLPVLIFGCYNNVLGSLANLRGDFKRPAIITICDNVVVIILTAALFHRSGIYALVVGLDAGFFLETCLLAVLVCRIWGNVFPRLRKGCGVILPLLKNYGAMALGAGVMSLSSFVDNSLASMLGVGAVSALSYANKIPSVLSGLGGATIATVLLPYFSETVHKKTAAEFWSTFKRLLASASFFLAPLALVAAFSSRFIVASVFERGGFDAQATTLVASLQFYYFMQIPFYLLGIMAARLLQAKLRFRLMLYIGTILFLTNASLSFILCFTIGVVGLPIASLATYIVSFCILMFCSRKIILQGV